MFLVLLAAPAVADTDWRWLEENDLQRFRRDIFQSSNFVYSVEQNTETTTKDLVITVDPKESGSFTIFNKNTHSYTHCTRQGDVITCH